MSSVLKLVVLIHVIKLNIKIKIKIVKSAKFTLLAVYKCGPIYKTLKYQEE
jgi:hypothetical protein